MRRISSTKSAGGRTADSAIEASEKCFWNKLVWIANNNFPTELFCKGEQKQQSFHLIDKYEATNAPLRPT